MEIIQINRLLLHPQIILILLQIIQGENNRIMLRDSQLHKIKQVIIILLMFQEAQRMKI
jgi:hypothetical protein